jgi:DNA-binding transcriptional MerR regulator
MDQGRYLIDELCRLTGFSRRTVRYYVQEGLVDPPAGRGRGGYYSDLHAAELARIRVLQEQGYRLDAIRGMLAPDFHASSPSLPLPEPHESTRSSWARHLVAPGVELHLSADAESRLGSAVATALVALRSIIHREGGLHD